MAKKRGTAEARKRAEEALRESEEKYRNIVETAPDGIVTVNLKGIVTSCNSAFTDITGFSKTEIVGKHFSKLPTLRASDIPKYIEMFNSLIRGKVPRPFEARWLHKDGTARWTEVHASLMKKDRKITGFQAILRDITERKRVEEQLKQYELIVESANDALFIKDLQSRYILVNNKVLELFGGIPRERVLGKTDEELLPLEDALHNIRDDQEVFRSGKQKDFIKKNTIEGRDYWFHATKIPLRDDRGNILGLVGIARDITERKRAEEVLRETRDYLQSLINYANAPIIVWDPGFRITRFNRAFEHLAGYTAAEVIGQELSTLFPEASREESLGKIARTLSGEYWKSVEIPILRKDGETRLALWNSANIYAEDGTTLLATIAQGIDMTERKRAEEVLHRSLDETAHRQRLLLVLSQAAQAVQRVCTPEEVYRTIGDEIASLGYHAVVFTLTDDRAHLTISHLTFEPAVVRAAEKLAGVSVEDFRLPLVPGSLLHRIIAEGETIFAHTGELMAETLPEALRPLGGRLADLLGLKQSILTALTVGGEAHGLLVVNGIDLTEADVAAVSAFVNQAAIAIQNARLYEEQESRATELTALNEIAMTLTSTLDLQEVLNAIQERVMEVLAEVYPALFFLLNEEDQTLEMMATHLQEEGLRKGERLIGVKLEELPIPLPALKPPLREALFAGKPYLTDDLSDLSELGISRKLLKGAQRVLEINSIVALPLWAKGKFAGTMLLLSQRERMPDEEIELLSSIANQAAIAIENARLYEQTDEKLQHRVAELAALNAIAQSLTGTLELDEMLESMVTRVAQVMRARICTIRLVEGDELTVGPAVGYKDESARQHRIKIDARLARVIRDQRPLLIEDLWRAEGIPPSRRMRALREGVHSFLGVPMISREKTIGILSIYGWEPHRFGEEEVRLLSTIANQVAIAIERTRLHEKIKRHATELEHLVEERTKELQAIQKELLQTSKLAALGQLAAGVAHELNNPLGAISGYLELLQEETKLEPRETEYVDRIERRIQQATKIVAELRSLGIPSQPVWQIVNVNDILEETLALVERRLSLDQVKVQKDITPDLPLLDADPDRLEQVFINIITNARQAMPEGGTLRVASRESRNGEWVEIILADTGEGIAKGHLDKIFDPFFTTRSPGQGMGLGLSLSHRHIKDHGGAIDVWSERGRGTVFRVALPPSGAKRCWEILDCDEKERCRAVRENADYRCWSVMEDVSRCQRCEVYRRKALPPLDGTLLPE